MAFPKKDLFPPFDREVAGLGRALGYPARIYILRVLRDEGPLQFTKLAARLPLGEGAITSHLRKLMQGGLIKVEVHGLVNIYAIDAKGIESMCRLHERLYDVLAKGRIEELIDVEKNGSRENTLRVMGEGSVGFSA